MLEARSSFDIVRYAGHLDWFHTRDPNSAAGVAARWLVGEEATKLFQQFHDLLIEEAETFVDSILAKAP